MYLVLKLLLSVGDQAGELIMVGYLEGQLVLDLVEQMVNLKTVLQAETEFKNFPNSAVKFIFLGFLVKKYSMIFW